MEKVLIFIMLFIPLLGFSQTGPGGVGTNDGTSTLEYWIDASNSTTGSSPITAWSDVSGNAVTNTINGDPTLTSNALNGYSVMTFDGAGDYISTNMSINAGVHPNLDIYLVYESDGTTSVGAPWGEDNGAFDRFMLRSNHGSGCNYSVSNGIDCTGSGDPALFPANTPIITGVSFDEDVANGSNIVTNGTNLITFSANHGPDGSNNFDVGSIGAGSFDYDGDIAELIVFGTNLNAAQRIILYNYLSAKYDIALTSNDIFNEDNAANGDYDHDVAGIGQASDGSNQNEAQGAGIIRILNPTNLDNNEFLIWGHDNQAIAANNTTDIPAATVGARIDRVWRISEADNLGASVDIGAIDIQFDLTSLAPVTLADLSLLVDTNNDGSFSDETPIFGATDLGGNIYSFSGVIDISDNSRISLGTARSLSTVPTLNQWGLIILALLLINISIVMMMKKTTEQSPQLNF